MSNGICGHDANPPTVRPLEDPAVARISEGLDILVEEMHPLGNVVQAFRELLLERERFKAGLPDFGALPIRAPDPRRFESGVPLSSVEELLGVIDDALWIAGAERLMPIMAASFSGIKEECGIIGNALPRGLIEPRALLKASFTGSEDGVLSAASRLGVKPQTLIFTLGQIAKPMIERISVHLISLVEGLAWGKGYCPICGTMPELAFVQGEGGQRWLRCASCSYEWQFTVLTCPFCENKTHEDFEIYYVAGREYEALSVCGKCARYVPTLDMRKRPRAIAREIAAMALMHLDVIAQEKGFLPAAVCAWNVLRDRDVFSVPVRV